MQAITGLLVYYHKALVFYVLAQAKTFSDCNLAYFALIIFFFSFPLPVSISCPPSPVYTREPG